MSKLPMLLFAVALTITVALFLGCNKRGNANATNNAPSRAADNNKMQNGSSCVSSQSTHVANAILLDADPFLKLDTSLLQSIDAACSSELVMATMSEGELENTFSTNVLRFLTVSEMPDWTRRQWATYTRVLSDDAYSNDVLFLCQLISSVDLTCYADVSQQLVDIATNLPNIATTKAILLYLQETSGHMGLSEETRAIGEITKTILSATQANASEWSDWYFSMSLPYHYGRDYEGGDKFFIAWKEDPRFANDKHTAFMIDYLSVCARTHFPGASPQDNIAGYLLLERLIKESQDPDATKRFQKMKDQLCTRAPYLTSIKQ